MPTRIIVGAERERALLDFGFAPGLLAAFAEPSAEPITSSVVASDGAVLADIAELPGVAGTLPEGRVVPVCHVDDSQLVYDLLVEDNDRWVLVRWMPEFTEVIVGGVDAYLGDLLVAAWESDAGPDAELVVWGERIGHPAPARLIAEIAVADRSTKQAHERWRMAFLASLRR